MSTAIKIEQRVEELLQKMTLSEKISMLSGQDIWNTAPVKRLGIPSITMTDGPHGVRSTGPETGRKMGATTAFPTGISMGAAWNPELVEQVGQALGEETRGMDCDILLAPCVNIVRDPRGGRNFETFSEDPYLTGRTAVAYIKGVQSRGVGTSLKHFAANNYEIERFRATSNVDERTLREIYLAQFEMAVKEAQPWTVMCSYNRLNGVYASQNNHLLNEILRGEWGFQGAVVSDWSANHTIFESVEGGLDLEMPGPAKYYKLLGEAVQNWQIDEAAVDQAVRRVLRLVVLSGRMEVDKKQDSKGAVNTTAHQKLSRRLAEEAITLLKNEGGLLPLGKDIRSIAVIGPNAAEAVIEGGGSSQVPPLYRVSPLEALRKRLDGKARIEYASGSDNVDEPFTIPTSWLEGGLHGDFYEAADFSGEPVAARDGFGTDFHWQMAWTPLPIKPMAMRWTGILTVPEDGAYKIALKHAGKVKLFLDGESILESAAAKHGAADLFVEAVAVQKLQAGKTYEIRMDYVRHPEQEIVNYSLAIGLTFEAGQDKRLAEAVALAKRSDVALVFAGYPETFESEGSDRPCMDLMGKQNELIAAVAAANPRTVVVLNVGAPVRMPWVDQVAAIVQAYYPGMENGNAVAAVLLGKVNPSGKLPVTFPVRLEDSPAFINASYPGCREVNYGEGIFVGYRYYDKKDVTPLFPFGHGLSYTTFVYRDLKVAKKVKAGKKVEVSLTVKNTGKVAGKEVVQLYVSDLKSSLPRPPKELKGFAKVSLEPEQSETVTFTLDERALSFYDPHMHAWVAEPGEFRVLTGSSSRDIRLKAKFVLE
jgi:beta-glucosidase